MPSTDTIIAPIDAVESLLISVILSGILWNVLEGYRLVPTRWLPAGILGTTVLLAAFFITETAWPTPRVRDRYRY
ncbi:MAG: hypothetical protein ABEH65_11160 [Halobacteriales archaeon]